MSTPKMSSFGMYTFYTKVTCNLGSVKTIGRYTKKIMNYNAITKQPYFLRYQGVENKSFMKINKTQSKYFRKGWGSFWTILSKSTRNSEMLT